MFISKVFSLLIVCLLAFCEISPAQTANFPQRQQKHKSELSLTMKRMACFDGCSVYNLDIQPDGKVIFEGIQYTKFQGKTKGILSKEQMNQIKSEINKADFFTLKDQYIKSNCPMITTDNPLVMLSIKLNGEEKTITHYLGCKEKFVKLGIPWKIFPQELYNLENKIDEIVETKRWVGERK